MNAVIVSTADSRMHFLDVARIAAGQTTDNGAEILVGDRLD